VGRYNSKSKERQNNTRGKKKKKRIEGGAWIGVWKGVEERMGKLSWQMKSADVDSKGKWKPSEGEGVENGFEHKKWEECKMHLGKTRMERCNTKVTKYLRKNGILGSNGMLEI
jgi:hypothetical protein